MNKFEIRITLTYPNGDTHSYNHLLDPKQVNDMLCTWEEREYEIVQANLHVGRPMNAHRAIRWMELRREFFKELGAICAGGIELLFRRVENKNRPTSSATVE
jgi:hypothetical protein